MADIKWGMHVDANGKELRNARIHNVNGDPSTPAAGQIWYDTATGKLKYRNATVVIDVTARANHTGTQVASTISDLATTVKAYRLDEFADATATIQGVAGVSASDYVIKSQLDAVQALATSGARKDPVRLATTANHGLTGLTAIDGVTPVGGDRILAKDQTTGSQNGIYVAAAGAWSRAADFAAASTQYPGTTLYVTEGTANGDKQFSITSDANVTVATTAHTWGQTGGGAITYTGSLGVQLVGNDFRANLGTGLTLSGNQIVPDYTGTNIMRRKIAVGFVGTTGTDVTVNHAFALADKSDCTVEVTEHSTGVKFLCGVTCQDVNNVVLSFETTPTSNQYRYQILGLS